MDSYYPICPDCGDGMRKIIEFKDSYEGDHWSTYIFQCPKCKRIDKCGKGRWSSDPYYICTK